MFTEQALIKQADGLKRFALKLTRNDSDADDLTQSTLLRAIEKSHMFEPGTNLFSWTSKIMYNQFVSGYRRRVKFETQYDPDTYIDRTSVSPVQDELLEFKEVEGAMDSLTPEHREILTMVCLDGMQYAEVAEALDIPVGTVRSRLSRARDSLQTLLDNPSASAVMPMPVRRHSEYMAMAA
jgi:RNA polymerase sigma-70 factor (ECF subfamily)